MDTNLDQKLPIDAVILWVNGNDKKHQDKILKFVKDKNLVKTKTKTINTCRNRLNFTTRIHNVINLSLQLFQMPTDKT